MTHVVVVGHADADGHVIAEQARRNLDSVEGFTVETVVDPERTQGHRSWLHLDRLTEIDRADLVVFVDLMFGPMTYAEEARALVQFTQARSTKQFLLIDHHPLPEQMLSAARNLRCIYRPDVIECTLGPRSGLMLLAALCENQYDIVRPIVQPHHDTLARGLRRAAAPGSALPGRLLMALLAASRWDTIYALAEDDAANHRLIRGRRPPDFTPSEIMLDVLREAERLAQQPLKPNVETLTEVQRRPAMPFDIDGETFVREDEQSPYRNAPVPTRDLAKLSTLMEAAALSLTDAPGASFTWEQLVQEVRQIAGEGTEIGDRDLKIVYEKVSFLSGGMKAGFTLK